MVSVLSWFAGLIYIGRLFIYLREAEERPEPERSILQKQLLLMTRRLWWGITWPAGVAATTFGLAMVHVWIDQPWMQVKLALTTLFVLYHLVCHRLFVAVYHHREHPWSSTALRVWNELLTLLMVSIVFLVVLKNTFSFLYGALGLLLFGLALMAGIALYKRVRSDAIPPVDH